MESRVKPIPDEYRGATPYLCVNDGARALEFYHKAFGAKEVMRIPMPDGKIGHAELRRPCVSPIEEAACNIFVLSSWPGIKRQSL